jgi:hypothetical protein
VVYVVLLFFGGFGQKKTNPNKANLFRIECCVMRIAKRNLKKQKQNRALAGNSKH